MATTADPIEISVADYAAWRGWSRWKTWRYFIELSEIYLDKSPVKKRGRVLYVAREQMAALNLPCPAADVAHPAVMRRLADLEARAQEQEGRINGLSREIIEFRRKSNEWFKGTEKRRVNAK